MVLLLLGLPAVAQPTGPAVPFLPPQVQSQPSSVESELSALEDAAKANEGDIEASRTEVQELKDRRERVQDSLYRRVRALYRMRRAGMLPVAGGFDAMLGHLGRMKRLERMVSGDLRSVAYLDRRATALEGDIADAERNLETQRRQMAQLAERRRLDAGRARTAELFADLLDPRNRLPVVPMADGDGYGLRLRDPEPRIRFDAQRGRLRLPVAAGGSVRDASREDGTGLEFVAGAGARVEAVSEGSVAFARRYGVYGHMVVIDHGESYFTVYSGMARVDVTPGEPVVLGQTLGALGGDPLYFEVRRGTRSLDPHEWVGI